jgi:hypothetical protein
MTQEDQLVASLAKREERLGKIVTGWQRGYVDALRDVRREVVEQGARTRLARALAAVVDHERSCGVDVDVSTVRRYLDVALSELRPGD